MSWFFIRYGSSTLRDLPRLPVTQYEYRTGDLLVLAGGPDTTCIFHSGIDGSGFVVCGAGLLDDGRRVHLMGVEDWKRYLLRDNVDVSQLGGHFACVAWTNKSIRFFNDALGIREIFFNNSNEGLTLSTHTNWIAATQSANTLNTSAFGGKWCLYIQSDHGSPIKEIERLGPGGNGSYDAVRGVTITRTQQLFDYHAAPEEEIQTAIAEKIKRYTIFPIESGEHVKLALSGGVDSRLILAALNDQAREKWDAFTFGHENDADVRVAKLLAEKLDFSLQVVQPPRINLKEAIDFVVQTDIFKPISAAYAHLSYHQLDHAIIIDGAPGELLRRRLFTKLEYLGAKSIAERKWEDVATYLWAEQPNIFSDELAAKLREQARDQVHRMGEGLPSSQEIGVGNWIDTMFCHLWFANTSGADQRRIDGIMLSTSPFSQPAMLTDVFHANERYRKSGKLAKQLLAQLSRAVVKYPYAKDEVIFPSWTPWYLAKLYGKLAKKRSPLATDQTRFLLEFKSEIIDALNSQPVRGCTLYDQKRLNDNVNAYYSGAHQHAAFVDCWYSFEVWRSANSVTSWV